jgi:hypothetical protein
VENRRAQEEMERHRQAQLADGLALLDGVQAERRREERAVVDMVRAQRVAGAAYEIQKRFRNHMVRSGGAAAEIATRRASLMTSPLRAGEGPASSPGGDASEVETGRGLHKQPSTLSMLKEMRSSRSLELDRPHTSAGTRGRVTLTHSSIDTGSFRMPRATDDERPRSPMVTSRTRTEVSSRTGPDRAYLGPSPGDRPATSAGLRTPLADRSPHGAGGSDERPVTPPRSGRARQGWGDPTSRRVESYASAPRGAERPGSFRSPSQFPSKVDRSLEVVPPEELETVLADLDVQLRSFSEGKIQRYLDEIHKSLAGTLGVW